MADIDALLTATGSPLTMTVEDLRTAMERLRDIMPVETRTALATLDVDEDVNVVVTGGYAAAGDGGGATYKRVGAEPSHAFKQQSGDLTWWEGVPRDGGIDVRQFGAKMDGVTNDATAIQDAIDYAEQFGVALAAALRVVLPAGEALISSGLSIGGDRVTIEGQGNWSTVLRYTGSSGAAISGDGTHRNHCAIRHMTIRCDTAGASSAEANLVKGLDFTWLGYGRFEGLLFDLRENNQIAVYAKGNGLGTGPYYNGFSYLVINGSDDPSLKPDQYGIRLSSATSGALLADGPNGNIFTTIKRIAGVKRAIEVRAGDANLFTDVHCEAIAQYITAFNERSADFTGTATSGTISSFTDTGASFSGLAGGAWSITAGTGSGENGTIRSSTGTTVNAQYNTRTAVVLDNTSQYQVIKSKAIGNKIRGLRVEGKATAQLARFFAGALQNVISDVRWTSIDSTQVWIKGVAEGSNLVSAAPFNTVIGLPFWVESPAANTTTGLKPNSNAGVGAGYRMWATNSILMGMSVACDDLNGISGSATVSVWKANINFSTIDVTLNASTRFGGLSWLKTYDSTSNARAEAQHDFDVRITTDASWTGTSKNINVMLWVQI